MGLANIRESGLMLWADSNLSGRYKVLAVIQQKREGGGIFLSPASLPRGFPCVEGQAWPGAEVQILNNRKSKQPLAIQKESCWKGAEGAENQCVLSTYCVPPGRASVSMCHKETGSEK